MPGVSGPPACPFIAYEDERDERSSTPDHRHRCYAEVRPAPRALAHQEAYCLSSAFPVCPTFQDWARREAAKARGGAGAESPATPPAPARATGGMADADEDRPALWHDEDRVVEDDEPEAGVAGSPGSVGAGPHGGADDTDEPDDEPVVHRNPPRDWAAPPPWATGAGAGGRRGADDETPGFLTGRQAGQGLAGSAADRMASDLSGGGAASPAEAGGASAASSRPDAQRPAPPTTPQRSSRPPKSSPPSEELAGLVGGGAAAAGSAGTGSRATAHDAGHEASYTDLEPMRRPPSGHFPTTAAAGRRPTVSSTRGNDHARTEHDGPTWERPRRFEAYPTLRARAGLPGVPVLALAAGALVVAAIALFFLPALLGVGGGGSGSSPTPTVSPSASGSVSVASSTPSPTAATLTYTVKKGDTLSKIAKNFNLTVDQLLAANKDTIKDPNKIGVGDVINIPSPSSGTLTDAPSLSPSPSPS